MGDGLVTFAPSRAPARVEMNLRLSLSEPTTFAEAPVEAYVVEAPAEIVAAPVSYSGPGYDASVPYRDPHLELADLLLAHEAS